MATQQAHQPDAPERRGKSGPPRAQVMRNTLGGVTLPNPGTTWGRRFIAGAAAYALLGSLFLAFRVDAYEAQGVEGVWAPTTHGGYVLVAWAVLGCVALACAISMGRFPRFIGAVCLALAGASFLAVLIGPIVATTSNGLSILHVASISRGTLAVGPVIFAVLSVVAGVLALMYRRLGMPRPTSA